MHTYEAKKFSLPSLEGISDESVKQHIGLYEGYVKNFNAMTETLWELEKDPEKNTHAIAEIIRRRSFEFGGMRLHELYFPQFEGNATPPSAEGFLSKELSEKYGSMEQVIAYMKRIGMTRGPGWALLYFDPVGKTFHFGFSGEQHQGHFATLPIVLALDVWEHAYLLDYGASGRAKYVDAFFRNLNWEVVENRFTALLS
jgi:Fe-Mn family superoxide dismutase